MTVYNCSHISSLVYIPTIFNNLIHSLLFTELLLICILQACNHLEFKN